MPDKPAAAPRAKRPAKAKADAPQVPSDVRVQELEARVARLENLPSIAVLLARN